MSIKRLKDSKIERFLSFSIVAIFLLLATNLFARTADRPWQPKRIMDFQWYAKNQWKLPITNYGTFGYGINRPGGEWPRGSGNMYIYGAGIWVGALPTQRETLVTCGYDPSSGSSEFTPGCWEFATTPGSYPNDFEKVYIYPESWPPDSSKFPPSMQGWYETPLRIPLPPPNVDTIHGRFYPVPRKTISTGDAWAVYNDRDMSRHVSLDSAIGIEIYQSTYSWSLPWNRDIVFFTLTIKNVSGHELKDMYLGMACDADIGDATDDMCGLILRKYVKSRTGADSVYADNVGYVFDSNFEEGWGVAPGYIGFDFLQSPYAFDRDHNGNGVIDSIDHIDNNSNGLIDEPGELEQLGMTSYKIFTLTAGDPPNNSAQYLAMTGHAWHPPYELNPYDSTDATPSDKRFLQATGPFNLDTNALTTVTIAVIAAPSNPVAGVGDLYQLAVASSAAQAAYDNNWIMPTPPPSPNVTLIPGEGRITLIWDNLPENAPDPFYPYAAALRNPFYREIDFQGYKVYKSLTGNVGEWQLLDQYDKIDGMVFEDTTVVESLRTNATDKGLSYAYIDSTNIRLGFPYYYAVTSYDVNTMDYVSATTDTSWLSLESGIDPNVAITRTTPINYSAPQYDIIQKRGRGKDTLKLTFSPTTLSNYAVKSDTFNIKFLAPTPTGDPKIPVYRFIVFPTNERDTTIIDTIIGIDTTWRTIRICDSIKQNFTSNIRQSTAPISFHPTTFDWVITNIVQNPDTATKLDTTKIYMPTTDLAFTLKMDSIPFQTFQRVTILHDTTYPKDSLQIPTEMTDNKALWAYRGSDYRVVWKWKDTNQTALTAEVYDLSLQQIVPYRRLAKSVVNTSDGDSADGWSFGALAQPTGSDTLAINITRYFNLCGGQLNFSRGNVIRILPNPGDTWVIYSARLSAAPSYSEFQIISHPMTVAESAISKLKVKVVPNPYLVRNEWERHPDFRKIKFINLPTECTIRIYNFAGDLIKTIKHAATKTEDPGNVPLEAGGDEDWNLLTESNQKPAPGVYLFHVESKTGNQIGKFVIIY